MNCAVCDEEIEEGDTDTVNCGVANIAILASPHGYTMDPESSFERAKAHRSCVLRTVLGGIGHLEDHSYWCENMHDPDGGRTPRQSGIECDRWSIEHKKETAVKLLEWVRHK